jgi:hypothetical protein
MLGYPLCPDDWDNQYIEKGKTNGCFCTEPENLEPPDDVVNAYRFYTWNWRDRFLPIDPATKIHAVKLVQGDITIRTFTTKQYFPQWKNGYDQTPLAWYLAIDRHACGVISDCYWDPFTGWPFPLTWDHHRRGLLVAVDADWAFDRVPLELQQVWADMIAYSMDDRRDIKSESAGTHSYTRFGKEDPTVSHATVIAEYAGPNAPGGDVGVL